MEDNFKKHLFVAVHAGAGFHSPDREADYKMICKKACSQAMALLNEKKSASEAACSAVMVLEDSELTNAGRGSSLTMDGTVECDASVMEGSSTLFGAVGCISGVMNPVKIAHHLLVTQRDNNLSHGRIPPSVLVGDGARQWAVQRGFSVDKHCKLITEKSKQLHRKYKRRIGKDRCPNGKKAKMKHDMNSSTPGASPSETAGGARSESMSTAKGVQDTHIHPSSSDFEVIDLAEGEACIQDTVGAVCVDFQGHMSAAVSSGGIWLKQPGRLGPAAMYDAGCWAQDPCSETPGVAVITSGCGEHIMRTLLAKTCAEYVQSADNASQGLSSCFKSQFLESKFLPNLESKFGGALAVKKVEMPELSEVELVWGHTTESMAIGYMSGTSYRPKALISRLADGCLPGKSFVMSGAHYSLLCEKNQDSN